MRKFAKMNHNPRGDAINRMLSDNAALQRELHQRDFWYAIVAVLMLGMTYPAAIGMVKIWSGM